MNTKFKYLLVFALYAVMLYSDPIMAVMAVDFSDIFTIHIIVYIGYWYIFRSDHLYNSFILVRYPSKMAYYKAYLYTEIMHAGVFTLLFVVTTLLARMLTVIIVLGPSAGAAKVNAAHVVMFAFSTVVNMVILRLIEQLIAMLTKRIMGNLFYFFYITGAVMNTIFTGYYPRSMNLFINSQIYRTQIFNVYECVASYAIVFLVIILLVRRLKRSSVSV